MPNGIAAGILKFIEGAHVLGNDGLRDYHAAAAVRDARRIRSVEKRFLEIRKILHPFRVTVTMDGPYIRLRRHDLNTEITI